MQNIISEQFQYIAALTRMLLCDIIVFIWKRNLCTRQTFICHFCCSNSFITLHFQPYFCGSKLTSRAWKEGKEVAFKEEAILESAQTSHYYDCRWWSGKEFRQKTIWLRDRLRLFLFSYYQITPAVANLKKVWSRAMLSCIENFATEDIFMELLVSSTKTFK